MALAAIGAAVVVCEPDGRAAAATPEAVALLRRMGVSLRSYPCPLPESLWALLLSSATGEAVEWVSGAAPDAGCLGCTRYPLGTTHSLLLMRDVSDKRAHLSRLLHRQRLESTGKLVASVAHDLRAPLASILFNAESLAHPDRSLSSEDAERAIQDICVSCERLRQTIDGLLGYARLGPQVILDVSVAETLQRVASFVRPVLREGQHTLKWHVHPDAAWVQGNPLILQQALINLVVNASETQSGLNITIESTVVPRQEREQRLVCISVRDDGPGVPTALQSRVFEAFFTTKRQGTGLGLTTSREALRDLGGDLVLLPSDQGAAFGVLVPEGAPPAAQGGVA
jgi:two-component system sensor histidine kinase FlrB